MGFNGTTLTAGGMTTQTDDEKLPSDHGKLNYRYTGPNDLFLYPLNDWYPARSGNITGVDVKLVHGDVWSEIHVGQYPNPSGQGSLLPLNGNLTTYIAGSETRSIGSFISEPPGGSVPGEITTPEGQGVLMGGNRTTTVYGVENLTIQPSGSVLETFHGPVNRTYMQDVSETYQGKHHSEGGDDWYSVKPTDINFVELSHALTILQMELAGLHLELAGFHFEAKPVHGQAFGIDQQAKSIDFKGVASDNDVTVLESRVKTLESTVAAARTHVAPTLNGAPTSLPGLH